MAYKGSSSTSGDSHNTSALQREPFWAYSLIQIVIFAEYLL